MYLLAVGAQLLRGSISVMYLTGRGLFLIYCLLYSRYCRKFCNDELELQHLCKQMQLQLCMWQKPESCLEQVEGVMKCTDVWFRTRVYCPPKLSCSLKSTSVQSQCQASELSLSYAYASIRQKFIIQYQIHCNQIFQLNLNHRNPHFRDLLCILPKY